MGDGHVNPYFPVMPWSAGGGDRVVSNSESYGPHTSVCALSHVVGDLMAKQRIQSVYFTSSAVENTNAGSGDRRVAPAQGFP